MIFIPHPALVNMLKCMIYMKHKPELSSIVFYANSHTGSILMRLIEDWCVSVHQDTPLCCFTTWTLPKSSNFIHLFSDSTFLGYHILTVSSVCITCFFNLIKFCYFTLHTQAPKYTDAHTGPIDVERWVMGLPHRNKHNVDTFSHMSAVTSVHI